MKYLLFVLFLATSISLNAQTVESEKINWGNLKTFSAKSFEFKTDSVTYKCTNCKYVIFDTESGVSGYYLLGDATYEIKSAKIKDKAMSALVRLSPENHDTIVKIDGKAELNDQGFKAHSRLILATIFKRSYHSAMEALIPKSGNYTWNIFGAKEGDFMAVYADGVMKIVNITK